MDKILLFESGFLTAIACICLLPLLLLVPLFSIADRQRRILASSFVLCLPALGLAGLLMLTFTPSSGHGGAGALHLLLALLWASLTSFTFCILAGLCVRRHRIALVWLVPQGLLLISIVGMVAYVVLMQLP